ncbi:MAG: EAL domain-containing protein [Actinomycetales bacterium]|nr:EAL domain-containing protein [Actinomycetales bacterium]
MSSSTGGWLAFQAFAGGVVAGVAALLFVWWRFNRRDTFVFWITMWLVPFAVLLVLNGAVTLTEPGTTLDTLALWLRSQALGASVILAMPALASVTGGPRVRWWMVAAGGLLAVRAVLFLTTDLVYAHRYVDGSPEYGPLITSSFAVPVIIVIVYAIRSIRRMPAALGRTVLIVLSLLGFGILALAFWLEEGVLAELLTSLWALPIVGVVLAVGVRRLRADIRRGIRQRDMRDAIASVTNAAWFDREPGQLLARAEASARALLNEPEIRGSLRQLANESHFASFAMPPSIAKDPQAVTFLDDLGHVVSAAAERRELHERLEVAAHADSLTGLPNRRRLDVVLTEAWAAVGDKRLAVLFCDIDAFKRVNEEFGHPIGDAVLQNTAAALEETVPQRATVARYGGDEFVVVLPDAPPDTEVVELAHSLQRAITDASPGKVRSVSIGVVVATGDEVREPYTLVRDADTAMFDAKHKRLGVRVFDQALRERLLREIDLGRRIARAVSDGEFEVHYQPIVDVASLRVVAVEALSRWSDDHVAREPEEWVPAAEESGQIVQIGLGAVRSARRASLSFGLPVGVNVSPRQLAEPDLALRLLEAWGPDQRENLTLEITESALLDDLPLGIETLETLRSEGVRIALDDFGTGYSSLARLAHLPVDVLKVDQQFAQDATSPRGRAVLRGIVEIAHASGLLVVVEGVETVEQFEIVAELGADQVQGYLLGRPSPTAPTPIHLPTA